MQRNQVRSYAESIWCPCAASQSRWTDSRVDWPAVYKSKSQRPKMREIAPTEPDGKDLSERPEDNSVVRTRRILFRTKRAWSLSRREACSSTFWVHGFNIISHPDPLLYRSIPPTFTQSLLFASMDCAGDFTEYEHWGSLWKQPCAIWGVCICHSSNNFRSPHQHPLTKSTEHSGDEMSCAWS